MKNKNLYRENRIKSIIAIFMTVFMVLMAFSCGNDWSYVQAADEASSNVIDDAKTGSITLHKYDLTAMEEDGLSTRTNAYGFADIDGEKELSQYVIKGVIFHYLRVADLYQSKENGQIDLWYGFSDSKLIELLGMKTEALSDAETLGYQKKEDSIYYYTSGQINQALEEALTKNNKNTKNNLESYIKANGGIQMPETDAEGKSYVQGLETGLYLLVETYVPEDVEYTTDPFLLSLPMSVEDQDGETSWSYDIHVYPKNQTDYPTIEKTVGDEDEYPDLKENESKELHDYITASEGDTLDYRVLSRLPRIESQATYFTQFSYVDQLSKGLTYVKDSVRVSWYDSLEKANLNDTKNAISVWSLSDGTNLFQASFSEDGQQMTVAMTEAGLKKINPDYAENYLVLSYQVKVKSDGSAVLGDAGNPNTVTLYYTRSNTSNSEYTDSLKDRANVFLYGANLTKKFSDQKGDASKAHFLLKNISDQQSEKVSEYYVVASGEDGIYHVTGETTDKDKATSFAPAKSGKLAIYGLEGDTYELTETSTDTGYVLLKSPVTIDLKSATAITTAQVKVTRSDASKEENHSEVGDTNVPDEDALYALKTNSSATVNGSGAVMTSDGNSENAAVELTITNQKGFSLPKTGDTTIAISVLIGLMLISGGMFGLLKNRKKQR